MKNNDLVWETQHCGEGHSQNKSSSFMLFSHKSQNLEQRQRLVDVNYNSRVHIYFRTASTLQRSKATFPCFCPSSQLNFFSYEDSFGGTTQYYIFQNSLDRFTKSTPEPRADQLGTSSAVTSVLNIVLSRKVLFLLLYFWPAKARRAFAIELHDA